MIQYYPSITGSLIVNGDVSITGSISTTAGITGSFSGTATTASYVLQAVSASYATTASFVTTAQTASSVSALNQTLIVSGSTSMTGSLQVTGSVSTTGTITAQTLVVQTVTSSVIYSSGSNIFGNNLTDTQKFTGSVLVTGSLSVTTTGTEFQVNPTGVKIGNVLTDTHTVTGSVYVTGGLYIAGNNIGVNTTSATSPLSLYYPSTGSEFNYIKMEMPSWGGSSNFKKNIIWHDSGQVVGAIGMSFASNQTYMDFHSFYNTAATTGSLMRIQGNGNVGIGTTSPAYTLDVNGPIRIAGTTAQALYLYGAATVKPYIVINEFGVRDWKIGAGTTSSGKLSITATLGGTDGITIDGSGNVGIGTSSPSYLLDVNGMARILRNGGDEALRISNDNGYIGFFNTANSTRSGYIQGNTTSLQISTSLAMPIQFLTSDAEKMRISSAGDVFIGCTGSPNSSVNGIGLLGVGSLGISRNGDLVAFFNRNTNDGTIIDLRQDNNIEGTISVSGTTVSYNSFLGSHWSQLQDGSRIEILKGTILETIDEMCIWDDEINDRLPKSKISDTIESKNVYGIFLDWDNDWQTSNDFYVSAVGLGYIRINANETIQIGDLLQSNGDGTAKVQSDDIMRSSTIAKVVLTNKIQTYEDGSYLVAATLHCG
jgi:hypothetical protein